MARFRFSLSGLAGTIAAIAIACACLVYASALTSRLVWGATLLILAFALLYAILAPSSRRGFCVGFAVMGWLYASFTYGPLSDLSNVTSLDPLLARAAEAMPQAKESAAISVDPSQSYDTLVRELILLNDGAATSRNPQATRLGFRYLGTQAQAAKNAEFIESFVKSANAFVALLLAVLGGLFGRHVHRYAAVT